MGIIIGLSGRMQSGKTTLADALVDRGFEKISIAHYLKDIVSKLYEIDIKFLYDPDKKNIKLDCPILWNEEIAYKLSKIMDVECKKIWNNDSCQLWSFRDVLQYIGNEVIRRYDYDFHIKKTIENISDDRNYVCDDIRYPNELKTFKGLGAHCIFIMRPNNFDVSNHDSEISLNWSYFKYHIVNNKKKSTFINCIMKFVDNLFIEASGRKKFLLSRNELLLLLYTYNFSTKKVANKINCSRDKIVWWCKRYLIYLSGNHYNYNHYAFMNANEESAYYAGLLSADGCIKKSGISKTCYVTELSSNDLTLITGLKRYLGSNKKIYRRSPRGKKNKILKSIIIHSAYIIENLKYWNLEPRKSKRNKVPDIIKGKPNLINTWFMGMIDGDGCIYFNKQRNWSIGVTVLASLEVITFLKEQYNYIQSSILPEKDIDNLYSLNFHGRHAMQLYNTIYNNSLGLKRKWEKFDYIIRHHKKKGLL